jgi:hypothetical protein
MANNDETVATFTHNGVEYEIDHLGICRPSQYGQFAIYRDGSQVAEFEVDDAVMKPEFRTGLPATTDLVRLAKEALATNEAPRVRRTEG